jgi:flagellar protein FliL
MAKEATAPEKATPAPVEGAAKGFQAKKLIMIGVPVFLVQLILIYFVIVKFIAPSAAGAPSAAHEDKATSSEGHGEHGGEGAAQSLFVVKDLIVNPAGTNGTRFLLTTVGFEVSSPEALKELEMKEVQVRDILNTVLTGKGLDELVDVNQREVLRGEISEKIGTLMKNGTLSSVYFSKFIIQ